MKTVKILCIIEKINNHVIRGHNTNKFALCVYNTYQIKKKIYPNKKYTADASASIINNIMKEYKNTNMLTGKNLNNINLLFKNFSEINIINDIII